MRPIDLARRFRISPSTLRNYEAQGILPPAERTESGYRVYGETHALYVAAMQALAPGFGPDIAGEALRRVRSGDIQGALWLLKEREAALVRDKREAEQAIHAFRAADDDRDADDPGAWRTIGEAAEATGVSRTAIRFWEREGLLRPTRDPENGYRRYGPADIRKLLLIRALRATVYSANVVRLRRTVAELDSGDTGRLREIAEETIAYMDRMNEAQAHGIYALYGLCLQLGLAETPGTVNDTDCELEDEGEEGDVHR